MHCFRRREGRREKERRGEDGTRVQTVHNIPAEEGLGLGNVSFSSISAKLLVQCLHKVSLGV